MKLINTKHYKNKLLKLKLIQTKIYKNNSNNKHIKIEDISSRLKKVFTIIYNYHINNKTILFVGTPVNLPIKIKNLLNKTNHFFIPESIWLSGILTNLESGIKYLSKNTNSINNKTYDVFFKMKKRSDLVVVFNFSDNQKAIIEAYLAKIPIVCLNCNLTTTNNNLNYKVPGNFKFKKKKIRDVLIYSILAAIFKKHKNKC